MARASCYLALLLLGVGLVAGDIKNIGWWKNTAFYQIYPRSFKDSNGDGIGDLNGITEKLDHFVDAGIGAIWLSPIYASPMVDFGYDISDFTAIHPDYGTIADFEALVAAAKKKELKVILDLVPNHSSDEHEWFNKSVYSVEPYTDYYIWKDGKNGNASVPPNNWISVFSGPAWTFNPIRNQWYFHQFHHKQPDLNYENAEVRKAMADVIQFWLSKGVDGFRVDAVPHLFEVDDFRDEPKSNNPNATPNDYTYLDHPYTKDQPKTYDLVKSWRMILDTYASIQWRDELVMMTEAYTYLNKTVEFYDAGAHIPFNFKFITDVNNKSPPSAFKTVIDTWTAEANKRHGTSNWVMGNHDRSRTETRYPDRGDQMTMLAMILPGVSVTYYGEEIGMVDKSDISWEDTQDPQGCQAGKDKFKERSRDPCRTPFQWDNTLNAGFSSSSKTWLPVHVNYTTLNLVAQKAANTSHYKLYQALTTLKKTKTALITGTLTTVVKNNDKALVIVRTHNVNSVANHTVLLVINFSETEELTIDLTAEVPSNLALSGKVAIATLNSSGAEGKTVDLKKLKLTSKTSLVIVADKKREAINNNSGNGANRSSIGLAKATIMLIATLLITLR